MPRVNDQQGVVADMAGPEWLGLLQKDFISSPAQVLPIDVWTDWAEGSSCRGQGGDSIAQRGRIWATSKAALTAPEMPTTQPAPHRLTCCCPPTDLADSCLSSGPPLTFPSSLCWGSELCTFDYSIPSPSQMGQRAHHRRVG